MGSFNQNSGWGQLQALGIAAKVPTTGNLYIVCPTTDPMYNRMAELFPNSPAGYQRLFPTLQSLITADPFTAGQNDVVVLSGYDTHTLTSAWALSKSRVHVYGLDWLLGDKRKEGQSTKISVATGAVADVLHVTGVRDSFHGIKFIMASTDAAALGVVTDAGEACLFEDCSAIFEVATNLGGTTAHELNCNGDTTLYKNCAFGTTQVLTSAARSVVNFARVTGSASGDATKSVRFEDCLLQVMSSSASAILAKVAATNALKFGNVMKNCEFLAVINGTNVAITLDNAIGSISGLVEGNLLVVNPATNCTKVCAGVTDNVKVVGAAPSATTGIGATPA